jgi:hypothetical protein
MNKKKCLRTMASSTFILEIKHDKQSCKKTTESKVALDCCVSLHP